MRNYTLSVLETIQNNGRVKYIPYISWSYRALGMVFIKQLKLPNRWVFENYIKDSGYLTSDEIISRIRSFMSPYAETPKFDTKKLAIEYATGIYLLLKQHEDEMTGEIIKSSSIVHEEKWGGS